MLSSSESPPTEALKLSTLSTCLRPEKGYEIQIQTENYNLNIDTFNLIPAKLTLSTSHFLLSLALM